MAEAGGRSSSILSPSTKLKSRHGRNLNRGTKTDSHEAGEETAEGMDKRGREDSCSARKAPGSSTGDDAVPSYKSFRTTKEGGG